MVGITIPLVLAVTFLAMWYWGIGLHKISLGSLIIALGLLVDDAIIAVEMMVRKMEEGYDKVRAATFAYEITAMPMLTGTLITAAGFLPIGIGKSVTGEYTFAIFAVTVIALVLSWFVSVYFVPYLGTLLLKAKPVAAAGQQRPTTTSTLTRVLPHLPPPGGLVCLAPLDHHWRHAADFALGIVGMGKVQQQFFPDSSRPEILVDIWFPEGTSFAANEEVTQACGAAPDAEAGVSSVSTWVGSGVPRFYLPLDQVFPQTNVSQFIVVAQGPEGARVAARQAAGAAGQEFPEVRGRVKLLPNGPPVPYPVQFRVVGPDPLVLRERADEVKAADAREPQHARRERQLERVGEGAASGSGPGQGARPGRHQPVDRAGIQDHLSGTPWASSARATSSSTSCCASRWTSATPSPTSPTPTCPRRRAGRSRSRRLPSRCSPGSRA